MAPGSAAPQTETELANVIERESVSDRARGARLRCMAYKAFSGKMSYWT
jgi:hypothetical protein